MRSIIALLVAFGILEACEGDQARRRQDSAPRLLEVVDLVIGRPEGEGADVFGRVSGLALDGEGRIYVADALANTVKVFTAEGDHLYNIGRGGSGPGEVQRPCCLAIDYRGLLWVRDGGNGRYNAYTVTPNSASYVTQIRMAHGDFAYAPRLTFSAEGHLIDIGHRPDPATGQRVLYRIHLDSTGSVAREEMVEVPTPEELGAVVIDQSTPESRTFSFVYPPYGPEQLLAHGPDGGFAHAINSRYEITWSSAGLDRTIVGPAILGPELTTEEQASAAEQLAARLRAVGAAESDGRLRVPLRRPPLRALFFDEAGRLWVQRHVGAGRDNEADVYDSDGSLVARVQWPSEIRLNAGLVLADQALGLRQDDLGTQQVVRLRLVPAP